MRAMRPGIALPVYQMLPSGPRVMPFGCESGLRSSAMPPVSSVIACVAGHRRPMRPGEAPAVNQSAPSPPSAMPNGLESAVRPVRYSLIEPSVLMRPMPAGSSDSVK